MNTIDHGEFDRCADTLFEQAGGAKDFGQVAKHLCFADCVELGNTIFRCIAGSRCDFLTHRISNAFERQCQQIVELKIS